MCVIFRCCNIIKYWSTIFPVSLCAMFLCFMKEKNAYKTKNNLITQQAETNRKWIENEHLPIYTLFESLSLKEAFFWMDIKKTIWFFFFFWGKVKLIWELRHTLFINLRLRQILNVATSALFYKTLRSAADKFTHSVVCGNTYATRNLPYTALLHYWSSKDSFLKINSSI